MRNKQFDDEILRRIQAERLNIRQEAEMRIQNKMQEKKQEERRGAMARKPLRLVAAVLAALILVGGGAVAAVHWNSRSLISYRDEKGQEKTNEALASHAQPIGQSFKGEFLSIDIVDAIFDGDALVTAWTLTSSAQEPVYLYCDILVNGKSPGMGTYTKVDELFVQPGETIQSGFSANTAEQDGNRDAQKCDVQMKFTAFAANGEMAEIPVAPDGAIELGTNANPNLSRAENLKASGLMREVDAVDAVFSTPRSAQSSFTWKSVEKDNGDYTLRLAQADLNLNSATFRLDRIFRDEAAVQKFEAYYTQNNKAGLYWDFHFLDESGDAYWYQIAMGEPVTPAPEKQADGTWIWSHTVEMSNLNKVPKKLTIIPSRSKVESPETILDFPEEAIEVLFN